MNLFNESINFFLTNKQKKLTDPKPLKSNVYSDAFPFSSCWHINYEGVDHSN